MNRIHTTNSNQSSNQKSMLPLKNTQSTSSLQKFKVLNTCPTTPKNGRLNPTVLV